MPSFPSQNSSGEKVYLLKLSRFSGFFSLLLLGTIGSVLFSMGVMLGLEFDSPAPTQVVTEKTQEPEPKPAQLEFIEKPEPQKIEPIVETPQSIEKRTEALLAKAEAELSLGEVPPIPKAPTNKLQATKLLFTVQVFSSKSQSRADELQLKLKKQGFPAYINQFQDRNQVVWFRVRVGRTSKSQAQATSRRLRQEAKIKHPALIQL